LSRTGQMQPSARASSEPGLGRSSIGSRLTGSTEGRQSLVYTL
jgi:hypothetical protein